MSAFSKSIFLSGVLGTTTSAVFAAGDLDISDTAFNNLTVQPANAQIRGAVPQADGKIVLAGAFTGINSNVRYHAARLETNGALESFNPYFSTQSGPLNASTNSVLVEGDGSLVYGGTFDRVNVVPGVSFATRRFIARLGSGGTADPGFVPDTTITVNSIAKQGSAYILATYQGHYMMQANGDLEPLFTSYPYGEVLSTLVQPDLKIFLAGTFFAPSPPVPDESPPVDNDYFDRVGPYGGIDPTFSPPKLNQRVNATALLRDGRILIGGFFNEVTTVTESSSTTVTQRALARLASNGIHDTNFKPTISHGAAVPAVQCIAVQADGKILIGGNFTQVSSTTTGGVTTTLDRSGIARLNADGTVDSTFDAKINSPNYQVDSISILENGKILVAGAFTTFQKGSSTYARPKIARLNNDPAISQIRTPSSTSIRWTRGGSAPEISSAAFQYSYDGNFWIDIGKGTRTTDGWQINFATPLPASCYIRALGTSTGGMYNGSTGIVSTTATYPIPSLAVAPSPGANVANAGTATVAPVTENTYRDYPFLLKNIGTGNLNFYTHTITGTHASQFTIVSAPTTGPIAGPSGNKPFTIRFAPNGLGSRTATLTFTSDDPNTPSYAITLAGSGVTPVEDWRYQYFTTIANTGNAADSADPDGDGHTNQFEFVAGLIPNNRASRFEQRVDASSGNTKIIFSPVVAGRTYEVLTNMDLGSTWTPATVGAPSDNGTERTLTETIAPDPKRFYRVRITKP